DKHCTPICCQPEELEQTLAGLRSAPRLIVTDSQVFGYVAERVPKGTMLTSFSVLMACYKGDGDVFVEGAKAIEGLTEESRVLIAEACTHAPASEDIGRVKLPMMLRRKVGAGLTVDVVGGADFPADLRGYDLVIHCGACMFTRSHVLSRLAQCREQGVPMTNYGIAIAHLQGILGRVVMPK
ncbi:MAG: [Tidjanibacter sp.]|nr:[FeFe] hydrogenase H-cluster maturation GTPase HydF [Tidjanibacter sp.]